VVNAQHALKTVLLVSTLKTFALNATMDMLLTLLLLHVRSLLLANSVSTSLRLPMPVLEFALKALSITNQCV